VALPGWLEPSWGVLGCSDVFHAFGDRSGGVGLVAQALRRGCSCSRSSFGPTGPPLMYAHASGSGASPRSPSLNPHKRCEDQALAIVSRIANKLEKVHVHAAQV
jgi:hypothetical protein